MDAVAEIGRNPVSKHQIQTECGDEQADAGWDYRTRLTRRPNSQARTGQGNIHLPCSADQVQDWQPFTRLIISCAICVTIHTQI